MELKKLQDCYTSLYFIFLNNQNFFTALPFFAKCIIFQRIWQGYVLVTSLLSAINFAIFWTYHKELWHWRCWECNSKRTSFCSLNTRDHPLQSFLFCLLSNFVPNTANRSVKMTLIRQTLVLGCSKYHKGWQLAGLVSIEK